MAEFSREEAEVNARVVYWGAKGAGKTTNVEAIRSKLRSDNRGELRRIPTRVDPSVHYEVLPIELGELGGVRTRLHVVAVPGGADQVPTRKQLLDQVDGVVFVVDAQRDRIEENLASLAELRRSLAAYGRTLADVPLVIQYNKRDLADAYALEELHRKLDMRGVAAFEAVATAGTAVLPTLTTISKRVVRFLREQAASPVAPQPAGPAVPAPPPGVSQFIDAAVEPAVAVAPPEPLAPSAPAPVSAEPLDAAPLSAVEAPAAEATPGPATSGSGAHASILSESYHPEADAAAAAAASARAFLDPGFDAMREEIEKEGAGRGFGPFEVAAVGRAQISGTNSVRLPVLLRDDGGQTLPVRLTVQIEPDLESND